MKKKISSSEELNRYYDLVNKKLKKYSDMDISPNKVVKYLKPGSMNFKKFISDDDDLKDVDGIEVILKDIIDDTYAAFKDGLFKTMKKGMLRKFENYFLTESLFIHNLSKEQIHAHERIIGDYFRISLSYIEIKNKNLHLYKVNDDGKERKISIFSKEELSQVKEDIITNMISSIMDKSYTFKSDNVEKKIEVSSFVNNESLIKILAEKVTNEDVIEAISANIDSEINAKYLGTKLDYYLFEIE